MIPKIIHYCWFGGNPLPELALKCIASWKEHCPDYEVREWNESNYDLDKCRYVREAYNAKKWAFVSDFARFDILYDYGGIYLDTDVELIRGIDDLVALGPYMGCEPYSYINEKYGVGAIASGLGIAAPKGLPLYRTILDDYEQDQFIKDDGSYNLKTVVQRISEYFKGYNYENNEIQIIDGIYIYPPEYFCPLDYYTGELTVTDNTRSIHHYAASWHDEKEKKYYDIERKLRNRFGTELGYKLSRLISLPYRIRKKLLNAKEKRM